MDFTKLPGFLLLLAGYLSFCLKHILWDDGVLDMVALILYPLLLYMHVHICTYNALSCTNKIHKIYLVLFLLSPCIGSV